MKHLRIVEDHRASKGLRLANYVIDYSVVFLVFFLIGVMAGYLYLYAGIEGLYNFVLNLGSDWVLENLLTAFLYFILMFTIEVLTKGRSLGKLITGTRVISLDGTSPTTYQYFVRSISRLVPFDALSFLGNNGWHDNWSNTRVINSKEYEKQLNNNREISSIGS